MPRASIPDKIYLYLYFTLIFLYFFNLHFPTTELSTPYSFAVPPAGHLSLSSEGGQGNLVRRLILISPVSWFCGGSAAARAVGFCSPAVLFNHVLVKTVPLKLHVHFAFVSLKNEAWFLKQFIGGKRGNGQFLLKTCRTLQRRCNKCKR